MTNNIHSASQKYYGIVQFELLGLYDLQDEIRNLSYFDVWRRLSLSVSIVKTIIQIPLLINTAFKKDTIDTNRYKQSEDYSHEEEGGLLGLQIEYGLEKAISLFESEEMSWCSSNSLNTSVSTYEHFGLLLSMKCSKFGNK